MKKTFCCLVVLFVIFTILPIKVIAQTPEPPPGSDDTFSTNSLFEPMDGLVQASLVNGGSPSGPPWKVERIDDRHVFSNTAHHNLKVDTLGNPHIVYGGDHLYHTWWGSGTWHTEVVDPAFNVGSYSSLAIDNQNYLHIAYYDADNKDLKYAQNRTGYWYITTLVSDGEVGAGTDIGVDSSRDPYFVYRDDTNGHLMFTALTNGNMEEPPENISGTVYPGSMFSMAMRGPGDIHVIFNSVSVSGPDLIGTLYYTSTKQTVAWQPDPVDYGNDLTGKKADIALDSAGNPHVVFGFAEDDYGYQWTRYFITYNYGSSWISNNFGDLVEVSLPDNLALALNNANQPTIAMQFDAKLYKYSWTGSAWDDELVESGTGTGFAPAIALYPASSPNAGNPAFAYFDDPGGRAVHLNYREIHIGSWWPSGGPALLDQSEKVGACSTTMTGPDGNPWLVYSGDTAHKLYFKRFYNGAWTPPQEIGSEYTGTINCFHAASIGGSKAAVLFTTEAAQLLYSTITCPGSSCVISPTSVIQSVLATPLNFIDLTLDANGYPHMVYLLVNGSNRQLVYLYDIGSGWVARFGPVIEQPSASYRPVSMKRTLGGVLHVAYQKYALWDSLYYVNYIRGNWSEPLRLGQDADQEEIYQGISVSLNSAGNPGVAYIDSSGMTQINLKQRSCNEILCTWPASPFVIDSWADPSAFRYPCLIIDALGSYRLSYVQAANGTFYLRYVQVNGPQMTFRSIVTYPGLGEMSSLALSPTGVGRVSFNDAFNGDLMFAWQYSQLFLPMVIK